ncbi:uncharacterized protein CTHT_0013950 [Thermochaetoides thermophila DSM 1495]|uniref:Uncharacterized protein n=1 Tax=Chaetomium thermophilum (strain DSM 1495 / CBS 144.50 / IMI 039719) TaxID=759272 RepID=G0S1K7_CHATD|nr:hypothetical protein CTHT_0013950 [Thermochaetoides thermophila DSM 1495]EGS22917.1 hypothetical protein CTHT_0013950 [Thermochaetoides thermophila DSM 1495]
MPLLLRLPLELVIVVYHYSQESLIWRFAAAVSTAEKVCRSSADPRMDLEPRPPRAFSIQEIVSWERNGDVVIAEKEGGVYKVPRFLKITIDSYGISRIERLETAPVYQGELVTDRAFVVTDIAQISGVEAILRDGLLRLRVPPAFQNCLWVWNTPAPPEQHRCRIYPEHLPLWQRFHAVELNRITGITFLWCNEIWAIHIHTPSSPSAYPTLQRLGEKRARHIIWTYLPLPENDHVDVLAIREREDRPGVANILVRSRLVGDVVLGVERRRGAVDRWLANAGPISFFYAEPREGRPVPLLGAYIPPQRSAMPSPRPFPIPDRIQVYFRSKPFYSWAPLINVSSAQVFHDPVTMTCRGILLHYHNGGARALGQCRVGVDPCTHTRRPRSVWWQTYWLPDGSGSVVRVRFVPDATGLRENDVGPGSQPPLGQWKGWKFRIMGDRIRTTKQDGSSDGDGDGPTEEREREKMLYMTFWFSRTAAYCEISTEPRQTLPRGFWEGVPESREGEE